MRIRGYCRNPCSSAMTIPANSIAAVLAFGGVRGQSPLGERVAALRQAQGPWDLWLAEESEGETSPTKIIFGKSRRPIDKLDF